jgi:MGT family glycosyltransferase
VSIRPPGVCPARAGGRAPPPWPVARPGAPIVYATLGTIFDTESGDLFSRLAAGLGALPVNVLLTVGRHVRPSEIGPRPPHVHVASFVPQAGVLPHCAAVVSHGGSGTVIGALAHGVPVVVLPLGADQDRNAGRVADLGTGVVLDPLTATPAEIGAATLRVLREPAFAGAARILAEEAAELPGAEVVVAAVEGLASSG